MSRKIIKELFLFPNYKIIVFQGTDKYYTVKSGHVCYGNYEGKASPYIDTDFSNNRINVYNFKMLGKLSELTDENTLTIFKEARYNKTDYPNFQDMDGAKLSSPLESIKSYLRSENWDIADDKTWIIIPKPAKKLAGTKLDIEFDICDEKFNHPMIKKILPVYFTQIKVDTKEIKYSVEIPDYLYDFLMLHPEIEKRPKSKVYESNVFSHLIQYIGNISTEAINLTKTDEASKKGKKVIMVSFGSSQRAERDSYQFGYIGNRTTIAYQYYVGYTFTEGFSNKQWICVDKRYESGKGFTVIPPTQRRVYIGVEGNKGNYKMMDWTQEREDFLNMIEVNFKKLSDNLNNYLSDLDGDKLDLLITNKTKLLN